MAKQTKEWKWWWNDPKELALWEQLNSLTPQEFDREVSPRLRDSLIYKYGNIYFFKPSDGQRPFLESNKLERYVHGNNGSGKSYLCGADLAYEVSGKSPYRDVNPAKYGDKLIWAFSPTFDIQRSSSQAILFSTDRPNSIGLLPSFKTIEEYGGYVSWGKNRCLDFVRFPDHTTLEFKTTEMQTFNLQAAGIDVCWFDEEPRTAKRKDEIGARLGRKNGHMIMSFILEEYDHWIINDVYNPYLEGKMPNTDFFFIDLEDNPAMTEEERQMFRSRVTGEGQQWRFTKGGQFVITPTGDRVFTNMSKMHVVPGLVENYDKLRPIHLSFDLGYRHPVCIGFQIDKHGRRKYLFCLDGKRIYLPDFIDQVRAFIRRYLPDIMGEHILLPHDANRHYDIPSGASRDVFLAKGYKKGQITTMYNKREHSFTVANDALGKMKGGEPVILMDQEYCGLLATCCTDYTRNDDGIPKEDAYFEDIADAFKMAENWIGTHGVGNIIPSREPSYHKIVIGV